MHLSRFFGFVSIESTFVTCAANCMKEVEHIIKNLKLVLRSISKAFFELHLFIILMLES